MFFTILLLNVLSVILLCLFSLENSHNMTVCLLYGIPWVLKCFLYSSLLLFLLFPSDFVQDLSSSLELLLFDQDCFISQAYLRILFIEFFSFKISTKFFLNDISLLNSPFSHELFSLFQGIVSIYCLITCWASFRCSFHKFPFPWNLLVKIYCVALEVSFHLVFCSLHSYIYIHMEIFFTERNVFWWVVLGCQLLWFWVISVI